MSPFKRYPDFARGVEIVDAFLRSIADWLEEAVRPTLRLVGELSLDDCRACTHGAPRPPS